MSRIDSDIKRWEEKLMKKKEEREVKRKATVERLQKRIEGKEATIAKLKNEISDMEIRISEMGKQ